MAGQFMTLGDLKSRMVYRCDLEGITDRHPTLNLNLEVNSSIRTFRTLCANNDVRPVMTPTVIVNLPTTEAVVGGGYSEIPWPSDAVSVHGLDVKVAGSRFWPLPKIDFAQRRNNSYGPSGDFTFQDEGSGWCERTLPSGSAFGSTNGTIMIFPVPSNGQYVLWYLQAFADVTTDSLEVPLGMEAWIEWVIWDVGIKCLIRDVGAADSAQLVHAIQERDRMWAIIKPNMQRLASDGPVAVQSRYSRGRYAHRMIP